MTRAQQFKLMWNQNSKLIKNVVDSLAFSFIKDIRLRSIEVSKFDVRFSVCIDKFDDFKFSCEYKVNELLSVSFFVDSLVSFVLLFSHVVCEFA